MRVWIQWATDPPQGFYGVLPGEWIRTPRRPPRPDHSRPEREVSAAPGWVARIAIQGIPVADEDRYSIIDHEDGSAEVLAWTPGASAYSWRCWPGTERVVHDMGNGRSLTCIGPRQRLTRWTPAGEECEPQWTSDGLAEVLDLATFRDPPVMMVRHGVWVSDALWRDLVAHDPPGVRAS